MRPCDSWLEWPLPRYVRSSDIYVYCKRLLSSLLSTVADSGCDHDEEYTNIQHFYGNRYTDETDVGVFQVRECQE